MLASSPPLTSKPAKRYICICGGEPSGGVAKFALLRPDPSLTSA
jgi:hypothetical protein